jgi:hypothetical protein
MFMKWMAVFTLVFLNGCVSTKGQFSPAYEPRVDWPEIEYESLKSATGANTVKGQAFLKTLGGDVKTAAGSEVILNPLTSYSTQFVEAMIYKSHGPGVILQPQLADSRIWSFTKKTTADAEGKFTFHNVPNGEYYIYTTVTWVASGYSQGGWLSKKINVESKNTNKFIMTGIDR